MNIEVIALHYLDLQSLASGVLFDIRPEILAMLQRT
jgi:hypothetical protein